MASGVKVNDEVKHVYNELKSMKYHYAVFAMNDDLTEIIVLSKKENVSKATPTDDGTYEELVKELTSAKDARGKSLCRYAVMDMPYSKGGMDKSKVLFFAWAPDDSPIKQKMIYASSKDALVKELQSGITKIQASDDGDLDKKDIQTKLINADRYE